MNLILFLISLFFEFFSIETQGGGFGGFNLGVNFFFLQGIPYLLLITLSIVLIFLLRISSAILFGVASCVMIGLNLFIFIITDTYRDEFISGRILSYTFLWGYYSAIFIWLGLCLINLTLVKIKFVKADGSAKLIKKTVLELGTQFANLEVGEISEACNIDQIAVIDTVKIMIENREIYAEYFNSSKSVAFNKRANIEEIDLLMTKYRDWEGELEKKL